MMFVKMIWLTISYRKFYRFSQFENEVEMEKKNTKKVDNDKATINL